MEMKEEIKEALVAATDKVFLEWQIKLHVVSGDIEPWIAMNFDDMLDKLAEQMVEILKRQPKLGVTKLEMLDGQVVDISNADLGPDIILKLADVEKYLREKEMI